MDKSMIKLSFWSTETLQGRLGIKHSKTIPIAKIILDREGQEFIMVCLPPCSAPKDKCVGEHQSILSILSYKGKLSVDSASARGSENGNCYSPLPLFYLWHLVCYSWFWHSAITCIYLGLCNRSAVPKECREIFCSPYQVTAHMYHWKNSFWSHLIRFFYWSYAFGEMSSVLSHGLQVMRGIKSFILSKESKAI